MLKKKMRKKIRDDEQGFTLMELLASLLIIALIATVTASGLPLVTDAYDKVVAQSDAGLLLSTVMTELRNELSTASELQSGADGRSIEYISASTGELTGLYLEDGGIFIKKLSRSSVSEVTDSRLLVPESTGRVLLKASCDKIELDGGIISICGLKITGENGTEYCGKDRYVIRNLAGA